MLNDKIILVTGGTGLVGSHVLLNLAKLFVLKVVIAVSTAITD